MRVLSSLRNYWLAMSFIHILLSAKGHKFANPANLASIHFHIHLNMYTCVIHIHIHIYLYNYINKYKMLSAHKICLHMFSLAFFSLHWLLYYHYCLSGSEVHWYFCCVCVSQISLKITSRIHKLRKLYIIAARGLPSVPKFRGW